MQAGIEDNTNTKARNFFTQKMTNFFFILVLTFADKIGISYETSIIYEYKETIINHEKVNEPFAFEPWLTIRILLIWKTELK